MSLTGIFLFAGIAALAAAQSWDPGALALLARSLDDREPRVRATAAAAVAAVDAGLHGERNRFKDALERLAGGDPDPGARMAAARALALLP
jgi:HEAT repeat protein